MQCCVSIFKWSPLQCSFNRDKFKGMPLMYEIIVEKFGFNVVLLNRNRVSSAEKGLESGTLLKLRNCVKKMLEDA